MKNRILMCFVGNHGGSGSVGAFSNGRPSCGGHADLLVRGEAREVVFSGRWVHHDHNRGAVVVVHVEVVAEDHTVGGLRRLPLSDDTIWTICDEGEVQWLAAGYWEELECRVLRRNIIIIF